MAPPRDDGVVTPERWQQIKGIVAQAMEMPPADRAAYVERECADDFDLCSEGNCSSGGPECSAMHRRE